MRELVLLVSLLNAPSAIAPTDAVAVMGQVQTFWQRASYGALPVTADVMGPIAIAYDGTGCDRNLIASQADAAATAAGIAVSNYDHRVYAFPHLTCGWAGFSTLGGVSPALVWANGEFDLRVVGHEIGHNLGLVHEDGLDCGATPTTPPCVPVNQADPIGLMGSGLGDLNLGSKAHLGYVQPQAITAEGVYAVATLEDVPSGLSLIRDVASLQQTDRFYLEHRAGVPGVRFVLESSLAATNDILTLHPPQNWSQAALRLGETFTDPGVAAFTVTADTPSGSTVNVTFLQPPLLCAPLTQTILPNTVTTLTASGGTGVYDWTDSYWQTLTTAYRNAGPSAQVFFPTVGTYTVTVQSGPRQASCAVVVQTAAPPPPPPPPPPPCKMRGKSGQCK